MHPHEMLANDVQAGFRQQLMHVRHPAIGGVFDRNHRKLRLTPADQIDSPLKRGNRFWLI